MKIVEVTSGLTTAITNEEADVLIQFDHDTPTLSKSDMSDRQIMLANQLVNKNLLIRKNDNGKIFYKKPTR